MSLLTCRPTLHLGHNVLWQISPFQRERERMHARIHTRAARARVLICNGVLFPEIIWSAKPKLLNNVVGTFMGGVFFFFFFLILIKNNNICKNLSSFNIHINYNMEKKKNSQCRLRVGLHCAFYQNVIEQNDHDGEKNKNLWGCLFLHNHGISIQMSV